MSEQVDARGLSCPQPVLMTKRALQRLGKGTLEVLVDTGTSRDNVTRIAEKEGWRVTVTKEGDGFHLSITKG